MPQPGMKLGSLLQGDLQQSNKTSSLILYKWGYCPTQNSLWSNSTDPCPHITTSCSWENVRMGFNSHLRQIQDSPFLIFVPKFSRTNRNAEGILWLRLYNINSSGSCPLSKFSDDSYIPLLHGIQPHDTVTAILPLLDKEWTHGLYYLPRDMKANNLKTVQSKIKLLAGLVL